MDMDMSMDGGDSSPLNASGVDFSNATQANDFLGEILDDSVFMMDSNMYARIFWYGIVVVIGMFGVAKIYFQAIAEQRLRAAAANRTNCTRPKSVLARWMATATALMREISYAQIKTGRVTLFKIPPAGTVALIAAYLGWVLLLEFVNNDVDGAQHYTSLGVRAAWLACAQVPLIILLAGKNNLIGLITGVSYERLNVLHRWSSRVILLLATLHVGFLHAAWNAYDLGPLEYETDSCIPTGWAVYAIILWMNISTLAPIRNLCYEFFVMQHIITFFGFIIAVIYHIPEVYARVYIYIPIGLYVLDRIIRTSRYAYNNVRPSRATLTAMDGGVTKICIRSTQLTQWTPGQHVFLSVPKFGIGQSHPATIASVPDSHNGELIFLLKAHKGFTRNLHRSCTSSVTSLTSKGDRSSAATTPVMSHLALIDGPYGNHADFAAFDSILLVAGSTGVTFTIALLLDIAARSKSRLPLKRIQFLWIVKNVSWTSWVSPELQTAFRTLEDAGIEIEIRVHVTCDDRLTDLNDNGPIKACDCACDKSLGPCCCVSPQQEDDITSDGITTLESDGLDEKKGAKLTRPQIITKSSSSFSSSSSGVRNRILPSATFYSGRPAFRSLLWDLLEAADGETGVAVCGPFGLSTEVRNTVVQVSDERAIHKGTGAQGLYLHVEGFGW